MCTTSQEPTAAAIHCDSSALDCAVMGSVSPTTAVGIHALGASFFGTQLDLYAGGGVSSVYEPGICASADACGIGACGIASGTLISAVSEHVIMIAGTFLYLLLHTETQTQPTKPMSKLTESLRAKTRMRTISRSGYVVARTCLMDASRVSLGRP